MDLDALLVDAKKRGELVYEMRQTYIKLFVMSKLPPGRCGPAPEKGSCAGLALRWIAHRQRGSDYPFNPKTQEYEEPYHEAACDQKTYDDAPGSPLDWVQQVMTRYHVAPNWGRYTSLPGGVTAERIERAVFAGDGLYFIEIHGPTSSHAIVVQRSGTTYRLFDSNRGHFLLQGLGRFREFVKVFLATVGKSGVYQDKYTVLFRVIGFDAPPAPAPAPTFPGPAPFCRKNGIGPQSLGRTPL